MRLGRSRDLLEALSLVRREGFAVNSGFHLYVEGDLPDPEMVTVCAGSAAVFTRPRPGKEGPNEDAALVVQLGEESGVLAVADGVGGAALGARASALALQSLLSSVREAVAEGSGVREAILSGFDRANQAVVELGVGAATTLAVAEIDGRTLRTYHVGDSLILVVGQRGKRKLQTIAHSPVGYAVEAGVLDEAEAMHHEERHLVSNLVGLPDMRVEMSAPLQLSPRDSLLLASDGLSDNLHLEELIDAVRKGPVDRAAGRVAGLALERMQEPDAREPSKPDDLSFVLYRRRPKPRQTVAGEAAEAAAPGATNDP